MIVVLRHGERADNSPFEADLKGIKLMFDPHLTELGLIQAEQCGNYLKNMLTELNPNLKNVLFISSPFLRCLQTADQVHKFIGFKVIEDKLFTQTQLGEMLRSSWFTEDINDKLTIKTSNEIKNQFTLELSEEPFVEDQRLIQQVYPENKLGDFYDRFKIAYEVIIEKFMKTYNQEETALVLVTHGFGVQVVLDKMNCFSYTDMVDYCSINIFDYREQSLPNKDYPIIPKVCVKQFHKHVIEADLEIQKRKQFKANM